MDHAADDIDCDDQYLWIVATAGTAMASNAGRVVEALRPASQSA
jgi:hypothetical protein